MDARQRSLTGFVNFASSTWITVLLAKSDIYSSKRVSPPDLNISWTAYFVLSFRNSQGSPVVGRVDPDSGTKKAQLRACCWNKLATHV